MKQILLFVAVGLFLASCGGKKDNASSEENAKKDTLTTFLVDTSASTVKWQRDVENKVENKQIQIFGATATVNMENVAYTSNGELPVIDGKLIYENEVVDRMDLTINFTMVRLFSKGSTEAISTETFPPSLLRIDKIAPDSIAGQFLMEGNLTIKDKTGSVKFTSTIKKQDKSVTLSGNLILQTLDWPIREDVNAANVKKDVISLSMELVFGNPVKKEKPTDD